MALGNDLFRLARKAVLSLRGTASSFIIPQGFRPPYSPSPRRTKLGSVLPSFLRSKSAAARSSNGINQHFLKPAVSHAVFPRHLKDPDMLIHAHHVTIVILNYNNADDTIMCLCALKKLLYKPRRIIIIDNNSQDDSLLRIRQWLDQEQPISIFVYGAESHRNPFDAKVRYILVSCAKNNGYAAGNNAGIRLALQDSSCRAVWILNNDTEPADNSLEALCGRLNDAPQSGLAGSTLVYAHDRATVQCAGGFALNRPTGATPAVCGGKPLEKVTNLPPDSFEKKLGYLCGASILVRRNVFEAVGLLPEEYFLYYEDAAFCLSAQNAGYTLAWAPDSIVFHKEGGSSGAESNTAGRSLKRSRFVDYLVLRNRIYLVRRYFPSFLPLAAASYVGVALNRLCRGQRRRLPLVIKALWDGWRKRMGKPTDFAPGDKKVNILFLTLRADFGGGPEHLWRLLQSMPEGMTACVACPNEYPYHERFRQIVGDDRILELPHRTFSLARLWALRAFCIENNVSILHSHGKGAGLYSRLLALLTGLPCVHTPHGVHIKNYSPGKRIVYCLYERTMSLFTKAGIAVSEGELNQILKLGLMPRTRLHLVPNGVIVPDRQEQQGDVVTNAPYTVVTFSRFDFQKNTTFVLDILHALKDKGRLKEFRVMAVGNGDDRQKILAAAQENALEDILYCPGASDAPQTFFTDALCYLSTSRWEGMPLAVLEAMAHALPVVASDVVGNRDVVNVQDKNNGFLYPEGNADAAAALLCRLADNPDLRNSMGEAAYRYVKNNHDVRMMAKKTFKILYAAAASD